MDDRSPKKLTLDDFANAKILIFHTLLPFFNPQSMLVCYLEERLCTLEETRSVLQAEIQENTAHGEALEALVCERCLPLELERYNLFIGDLERVVNLLLCLSARLARVQNALSMVDQDTDAEEKVRMFTYCVRHEYIIMITIIHMLHPYGHSYCIIVHAR